jgi:glycosyltransferase involved in cell wall biosynthesis
MKGRRVVFVLGNLELGGAERQAFILAKHLVDHERAEVEVWGFNTSGPVAAICEQFGIASRVVPFPLHADRMQQEAAIPELAVLLREARPDLLLPYTTLPNVVCGLVWETTGAGLCVWNQRDEGIIAFDTEWELEAARRTPLFIANSRAGASFLTGKLNVAAEKVRVVPNGVATSPPQLDRCAWRKRLEIDESSFVACMIANLHANKDHATLLQAWRLVVNALERNAVLILAGRHYGAYQSLVDLASELGIERNVRFPGQVGDVSGLLSAVDIAVFSSRSEGCPNGVLECMAAGLPVVGTDIEGVREVAGTSDLLAPFGDADRFAALIVKLANDPELRSTIGAENQQRIAAHYSAGRMCEDTVSLLIQSIHRLHR